ncbi:hypothetical protein RND81_04G083100 [Saponaria officinalis]|uniref:Transmembrane protein n=1 Tax=Saponaria officinalis TaxID=3572 RepID=A0AAW1LM75_SAPOF
MTFLGLKVTTLMNKGLSRLPLSFISLPHSFISHFDVTTHNQQQLQPNTSPKPSSILSPSSFPEFTPPPPPAMPPCSTHFRPPTTISLPKNSDPVVRWWPLVLVVGIFCFLFFLFRFSDLTISSITITITMTFSINTQLPTIFFKPSYSKPK